MFAAALIVVVLRSYDVPLRETALFCTYLVLGVVLPGLLVVRALWGGRMALAEEIALGLALGYTVETLVYIVGRSAGIPLAVLAWPVGTYLVFCAAPRLRRHWRGTAQPKTPLWWSWSVALILSYLTVVFAAAFFKVYDIVQPGVWATSTDMPYHLSMIGELRHHMPPDVPTVAGEPLLYHWFVYAHFAAASWVTGLEPLVLLFRLGTLPMLIALLVLVGMTGRRITGSWLGGLLCVACTVFLRAPNLHQGANKTFAHGGVQDAAWISPTQVMGALLFAPVVLLLLELLRSRRHEVGRWLLLGIFSIGVMGGKATYLPMLGVGLLLVILVEAVRRRRIPWAALAALGVTGACFLFAQLVLFGGAQLGMVFDPLHIIRIGWMRLTEGPDGSEAPSQATILGFAALYVLSWAVAWSGIFGLLSRPRLLMRPGVLLMLGIGASGLGVMLLFGHPGFSQLFFLISALPYLSIVAVYGLLILVRRARVPARATVAAAGTGAAAAFLLPSWGVRLPLGPEGEVSSLYPPYVALAVIAGVVLTVLAVRLGNRRAWAFGGVALMALSMPGLAYEQLGRVEPSTLLAKPVRSVKPAVPKSAFTALRWLRTHSDPDELVATNVHCRWDARFPCHALRLWVSAFSQRRVLLEGWAFTQKNLKNWRPGPSSRSSLQYPFWDQKRFDANRAAFENPSAVSIRRLRERYGVSWLFVDERRVVPASGLRNLLEPRFRSGHYSLYWIADGARPAGDL
ncbi:hypothetical protein ACFOWE_05950 [Planomonospora corallina]|uniref:Uncharacterized protein n=1 Tax=Planomonospora corallina TaxID=1806052 RepID=A0ABV8I129_9ACTN